MASVLNEWRSAKNLTPPVAKPQNDRSVGTACVPRHSDAKKGATDALRGLWIHFSRFPALVPEEGIEAFATFQAISVILRFWMTPAEIGRAMRIDRPADADPLSPAVLRTGGAIFRGIALGLTGDASLTDAEASDVWGQAMALVDGAGVAVGTLAGELPKGDARESMSAVGRALRGAAMMLATRWREETPETPETPAEPEGDAAAYHRVVGAVDLAEEVAIEGAADRDAAGDPEGATELRTTGAVLRGLCFAIAGAPSTVGAAPSAQRTADGEIGAVDALAEGTGSIEAAAATCAALVGRLPENEGRARATLRFLAVALRAMAVTLASDATVGADGAT